VAVRRAFTTVGLVAASLRAAGTLTGSAPFMLRGNIEPILEPVVR